jgi:hydroxyacylglutathione hydrolase
MDLEITTMAVAPLGCNCSIIRDPVSGDTVVVDPGGDADRIISILTEKSCKVTHIIHTHAHFDHVLGTHEVAEHCAASGSRPDVCLHPGDNGLYRMLPQQCGWFGLPPQEAREAVTHPLRDEEEIVLGQRRLQVLFTPGHTPGSCSFHLPEEGIFVQRRYVICSWHWPNRPPGRGLRADYQKH